MQTRRSPRTVIGVAYHLARRLLPEHSCKFSRHDFTLAQLFARLVLREFFGLSFRRTETLLIDSPVWLADINLAKASDHNTLWRAFESLLSTRRCSSMLDLLAELFAQARLLSPRRRSRALAVDSTCFERHHRSAHYDRRCRRMALKDAKRPGKWGKSVNAARSDSLRRLPKLSVAARQRLSSDPGRAGAGRQRFGLAGLRTAAAPGEPAGPRRGGGRGRCRVRCRAQPPPGARRPGRAVADPAPLIGRPTGKPPGGRWRRHMAKRLKQASGKKQYGQRAQSETTHSMIERNQSAALRSRTPQRQNRA